MTEIKQELKGIKRIMVIQFYIISVLCLCFGIIIGVRSKRWFEAFELTSVLLAIMCFHAPLVYWRAKQRVLEAYRA